MRPHAKAWSAATPVRGGNRLHRFFRRAFATRASSSPADGSGTRSRAPLAVAAFSVALLAAAALILAIGPSASFAAATHPFLPSLSHGGYGDPCGVVTDSQGDLYVAAYEDNKVSVYDPSGALLTEFTPSANAEMPCALAVDSAGDVYVTGWGTDVVKYSPSAYPPSGSTTYSADTSVNGTGTLVASGASSVAVDPATDNVYVAEGNHISSYEPDGTPISETIGEGVSGASYYGVDVYGATGQVYATDKAHEKAYVFNPSGSEVRVEIDGSDSPEGAFTSMAYPYLAVDQSNGHAFVSDLPGHEVVDEFDAAGHFVSQLGPTAGETNLHEAEPSDIAVDNGASSPNQGSVYVSSFVYGDPESGHAFAFGPVTPPTHPFLPSLSHGGYGDPCGVVTDSQGDLYVAAYEDNKVSVYDPSGALLTEFTPSANAEMPCALAVDSAGDVYVTGWGTDVVKYSPSAYPPSGSTTYSADTSVNGTGTLVASGASSVAVDPATDNVYVAEGNHISSYEPDGTPISETIGEGVSGASYYGVDVYGATGQVYATDKAHEKAYVFNPSGSEVRVEIDGSDSPEGAFTSMAYPYLAVDQSNGHAFVSDLPGHEVVDEFDAAGHFVSQLGPTAGETNLHEAEPSDIAVDNGASSPNQGSVYVSSFVYGDPESGHAFAFGPLTYAQPPTVTTAAASGIGLTEATLEGTVNPSGQAVEACSFDYVSEASYQEGGYAGAESVPCEPGAGELGSGKNPVSVQAGLAELEEGVTYHFHLRAGNVAGSAHSEDRTFSTLITPTLNGVSASAGSSSVTLRAEINPHGYDTTYHFEYVDNATFAESGFAEATSVPVPDADIGSSTTPVAVVKQVTALEPGSTYHYRVIASSASGTRTGSDHTFVTAPVGVGQTFGLPDSRAYELVSPAEKNGYPVKPISTTQSSVAGSGVVFASDGAFADAPVAIQPVTYESNRGTTGWTTTSLSPPAETGGQYAPGNVTNRVLAASDDLSSAVVESEEPALAPGAPSGVPNLYLYDTATGSYRLITTSKPSPMPGRYELSYAGSTPDMSHILFQATGNLIPGSGAPDERVNLYEWHEGQLSLISTDPPAPRGSVAGNGAEEGSFVHGPTRGAISSDGSRVVFTANGGGDEPNGDPNPNSGANGNRGQVWLDDNGHLIHVSESQASSGSTSPERTEFIAATPDASKILFLSNSHLTDDAAPAAANANAPEQQDLYEYDVASAKLIDLTPDTTAPAQVSSAIASEDLSYIYFAACGQLVEGKGRTCAHNEVFNDTHRNLYLYHEGALTFVANIAVNKDPGWRLAVGLSGEAAYTGLAEGGRALAFGSTEELTGYDTEGLQEIYLFHAERGELECVSCDPSGAPPTGGAELADETYIPGLHESTVSRYVSRSISTDGKRIFFTSRDRLVPRDRNDVRDVYEWEEGRLHLISSGESADASMLADISPSGSDVFFYTTQGLVPNDTDGLYDVYDAREGGGFSASQGASAPACEGDACHGSARSPAAAAGPASGSFRGAGNVSGARDCSALSRRMRRVVHRVKALRRRAKVLTRRARRAHSPRAARNLRRRAHRLARQTKRCRRANRGVGK